MSKRRLTIKIKLSRTEADLLPAARAFARLLNPKLAKAVSDTAMILEAVNSDETAIVDPAEERRAQLLEQMAQLQEELRMLEGRA